MQLSFSKYEGTGNDFILIDDRERIFPLSSADIPKLCHRQYGIGADGLILLQPSEKADYSMRIFNSNGREAEMCGNGLRCLVDFLRSLRAIEESVMIEIEERSYPCIWRPEGVRVEMGLPEILATEKDSTLIKVGVPHLVLFVDDLRRFDEEAEERFSLTGVNINYAKVNPHGQISMRTFERGVEAETLSCGSGATAVCYAAAMQFGLSGPIEVEFHSGEKLQFDLLMRDEILREVFMTGKVRQVFDGKVHL
ncbi:MAG: Diaminopimelate epimerase [Chlamydiae bacterium]|nr:Diaminopimelate epimerase [Chlamydiota bacterium]